MDTTRAPRLVHTVLRCYPARWRRLHGEEAAELAALLLQDGTAVRSIVCSYLIGAARERLTPPPGGRLRIVAYTLAAACALGAAGGLLASATPARAASTSQVRGHMHRRPGGQEPGLVTGPATGHHR